MSREWLSRHRSAVRQSVRIALVVGPSLVLVNNYDSILRMAVPEHFWLKAVATFLVPFFVSLYSAVRYASRGRVDRDSASP